jgi:hypothetical protein
MAMPLFGEAGRRQERIEWGHRYTRNNAFGNKGQVVPCCGEAQARGYDGAFYPGGPKSFEPVRRVVVTYTGVWDKA